MSDRNSFLRMMISPSTALGSTPILSSTSSYRVTETLRRYLRILPRLWTSWRSAWRFSTSRGEALRCSKMLRMRSVRMAAARDDGQPYFLLASRKPRHSPCTSDEPVSPSARPNICTICRLL